MSLGSRPAAKAGPARRRSGTLGRAAAVGGEGAARALGREIDCDGAVWAALTQRMKNSRGVRRLSC